MTLTWTPAEVIEWTTRILSVYFLIDSAEKLSLYQQYKKYGFFGQAILQSSGFYKSRNSVIRAMLNAVYHFQGWLILNILRGGCGLWLFLSPRQGPKSVFCLLCLFIAASLINFRNRSFGPETENRFALAITGALFLQSISPTVAVTYACLWFIALQSCVSYATAGITKLLEKEWRNGNGLSMTINNRETILSGHMVLFFNRKKTLLKIITWVVIGMDSLFPLVLIVGSPYYFVFIIWGICFHLFIAIFLRLGKFFWVWTATYPALIFIAGKIHW